MLFKCQLVMMTWKIITYYKLLTRKNFEYLRKAEGKKLKAIFGRLWILSWNCSFAFCIIERKRYTFRIMLTGIFLGRTYTHAYYVSSNMHALTLVSIAYFTRKLLGHFFINKYTGHLFQQDICSIQIVLASFNSFL